MGNFNKISDELENDITGYTSSTINPDIKGLFLQANQLTTAALDQLITDIYNDRATFTQSGSQNPPWTSISFYDTPHLNISNNAGTLTGTYQDPGGPPTTPAEMAYVLVNDSNTEGFNTWTIMQ